MQTEVRNCQVYFWAIIHRTGCWRNPFIWLLLSTGNSWASHDYKNEEQSTCSANKEHSFDVASSQYGTCNINSHSFSWIKLQLNLYLNQGTIAGRLQGLKRKQENHKGIELWWLLHRQGTGDLENPQSWIFADAEYLETVWFIIFPRTWSAYMCF